MRRDKQMCGHVSARFGGENEARRVIGGGRRRGLDAQVERTAVGPDANHGAQLRGDKPLPGGEIVLLQKSQRARRLLDLLGALNFRCKSKHGQLLRYPLMAPIVMPSVSRF